jgi:hypothetical protein
MPNESKNCKDAASEQNAASRLKGQAAFHRRCNFTPPFGAQTSPTQSSPE